MWIQPTNGQLQLQHKLDKLPSHLLNQSHLSEQGKTMEKLLVFKGFLHSLGAWQGWLGHLGSCLGGCWLQENYFSWILGLCGDILVAGQCLKALLDAPWLGAGWLSGGSPGGAQDGREPSEVGFCSAGEARGGRAETLQISFPGTSGL